MTMVTRQNLLAEKTRFLISVGGIALSVFLISFLLSLYQGWQLTVGRFVERVDTDIWVMREGTISFLTAASILPSDMQEELARLPGVADADALIVRPMKVEVDSGRQGTHLVGYAVQDGAGGPLTHTKGKPAPGEDEAIIDSAFAARTGVDVGDKMQASGKELTVVGVSRGGDFVFSQTTFVSLSTARALLSMDGLSTFYLLRLEEGADREAVAHSVEETFAGVSAVTGDEFADATRDQIMGNVTPILIIILLLAFVVGVAITGLTIYNATVEKAREFGILKAIGFTNQYLFRLVLEQSLATGVLGFLIGGGLAAVATRFVGNVVPQFVTLLRWQDILLVLATTLLMSLIAGLLPVRRIASVDPVSVFSG